MKILSQKQNRSFFFHLSSTLLCVACATCVAASGVLISATANAGVKEAYEHLYEVMDKYHETFDVYTDLNSGGNHYYPTGWMGDTTALTIEENWTSDCYSGTSCIQIFYSSDNGEWSGVYWQYPENNWATTQDAGYNLNGATELTFWAKGETGNEVVEFYMGGITGDYPDSATKTSTGSVQLTTTWEQYTISLAGLDLSHIIGGFGFSLLPASNQAGATFYLDDIRYNQSRTGKPRFLASYEALSTTGEPDKYVTNTCYIYDNALTLIAFLARGSEEDLRRARLIADAFVTVQNSDAYYADGRLRNAYSSGDLLDHETGNARSPGWWDTEDREWYEDEFNASTHTGNMAWTIIALLQAYNRFEDDAYLNAALEMGEWIQENTSDDNCDGGYSGGHEGFHTDLAQITWKSVEHNIDTFVAFMLLSQASGDSAWEERAAGASDFVAALWNDDDQHFWTGTGEDGCTINTGNVPVDIQAWALMAIGGYEPALKWAEENCLTEADGFIGFDFNNTDLDGIWFEGTSQMAVAYQLAGRPQQSALAISQVRNAQTQADNSNGKGIVAASHDGVTTGFDWEYYSRLHVGATAWYIFAEMKYNPYWGTDTE